MRRKLAMLTATALAAGALTVGAASPAQANHCDPILSTDDPVILFTCAVVDTVPPPGPTIQHYYDVAFDTVHFVYCTASPRC